MKIQVWIEIRKNGVFHVIHIEERRQIIHELRFAFLRSRKFILSRWRQALHGIIEVGGQLLWARTGKVSDCI